MKLKIFVGTKEEVQKQYHKWALGKIIQNTDVALIQTKNSGEVICVAIWYITETEYWSELEKQTCMDMGGSKP